MSDQPESVWRVKPYTPSQAKHGLASWPLPEQAGPGATEYTRKDVSDAKLAKAREDALREAAAVLNRNLGKPAHHAHGAILALIDRTAEGKA